MLTKGDLDVVMNYLWRIRHKWKYIGLALKIDSTTLEVIELDKFQVVDDCFVEMLSKWLRNNNPRPCWKCLADALQSPSVGIQVKEMQPGLLYFVKYMSFRCYYADLHIYVLYFLRESSVP